MTKKEFDDALQTLKGVMGATVWYSEDNVKERAIVTHVEIHIDNKFGLISYNITLENKYNKNKPCKTVYSADNLYFSENECNIAIASYLEEVAHNKRLDALGLEQRATELRAEYTNGSDAPQIKGI